MSKIIPPFVDPINLGVIELLIYILLFHPISSSIVDPSHSHFPTFLLPLSLFYNLPPTPRQKRTSKPSFAPPCRACGGTDYKRPNSRFGTKGLRAIIDGAEYSPLNGLEDSEDEHPPPSKSSAV